MMIMVLLPVVVVVLEEEEEEEEEEEAVNKTDMDVDMERSSKKGLIRHRPEECYRR